LKELVEELKELKEFKGQEAVKKSTETDPIRNYCLRVVAARLRW
jgi:hypothetical protein